MLLLGELAIYELERERWFEFRGEGSERHYQVVGGGGNSSCCLEGSQALPASPSDRVGFDFSVKNNLMLGSWRYGGCLVRNLKI
jgi:hypothetical protein